MKYYEEFNDTVPRDELLAGPEQRVTIVNVDIDSGTSIARGTILAADKFGEVFAPITTADTDKVLVINAYDTETDDLTASVYASGLFNREKLVFDEEIALADFENSLRKQNIFLTSIK